MQQTLIQIRVDRPLKEEVSDIFSSLGIDMSTAVRMFFQRCRKVRGSFLPIVLFLCLGTGHLSRNGHPRQRLHAICVVSLRNPLLVVLRSTLTISIKCPAGHMSVSPPSLSLNPCLSQSSGLLLVGDISLS